MKLTASDIKWHKSYRLVPSIYPPISLFDRVADQDEYDALYALEGMTNDRIRQEQGNINLVDAADRMFGDGSTPIMAAFTHPNPNGSRFTNGAYGIYYAAYDVGTAIAEVSHHMAKFYSATNEGALKTDMRTYIAAVNAALTDIRGLQAALTDIYDPNDYAAAQAFGAKQKLDNSMGIAYSSVRNAGEECVAILRPPALSPAVQGTHYQFSWDGVAISGVRAYKS